MPRPTMSDTLVHVTEGPRWGWRCRRHDQLTRIDGHRSSLLLLCFKWPGTESNRRHADFQSAALPTELPGRTPCADCDAVSQCNSAPEALEPLGAAPLRSRYNSCNSLPRRGRRYRIALIRLDGITGDTMSKLLRGIAAGYGARKLTGGCGCMGIIVFIILWFLLGNFGIFQ